MNLQDLVKKPNVTIIDVREPFEYFFGHVKDSLNIPLGSVPEKIADIKKMSKPIILVCASGNRSGQATQFLKSKGLNDVHNGGSWSSVKQLIRS